jgi:hypothetical protein
MKDLCPARVIRAGRVFGCNKHVEGRVRSRAAEAAFQVLVNGKDACILRIFAARLDPYHISLLRGRQRFRTRQVFGVDMEFYVVVLIMLEIAVLSKLTENSARQSRKHGA